ncbi:MAG TPA: glycerophosphodiester phosphodiesterase family protein [Jatrophihabitans sp.]|jgi:glycerophosphoryl diester phosphodiesterase|uniref:glycerophosphodiester phosphodiesterase n=1 Tax=Jatrophihabitans sp. TaxID=1932789 RepID=UPI002DF8261F|nr:glycerophosphodiester phosphodiesterase family protein [Jatrophihabitans sp.]
MLVAHRGASSEVAEHTLAAYESAIALGADALECDVRMTRDEHLVCVHDRTVNRTSDGRGVVSELDLPSLSRLNFSSWRGELPDSADALLSDSPYHDGVDPDVVERGGGVLTLEMLLGLVHDADREVRLLIETKHPTRYGGLVEKTLVELLDRFGWAGPAGPAPSLRQPADMDNRVVVMSFAPTAVRRIRLLAPNIPTVLLMDRLYPLRRDGMLPAGVSIAGPGLHLLKADPDFVARAHARGLPVYVWTVDEPQDVRFVLDLGVDTIITDRPGEVRALLEHRQSVQ